jgi:pseudaminic acid synthase
MNALQIGNHLITDSSSIFIIAELSANHNHNFETAVKTIHAAKAAGADAIKLQTYTADTITLDCDNEFFQIKHGTIWDGTTFYKLYQQAYTPWAWQPELKKIAESIGLICFSSPFDYTAVDFLEEMNVPAYKVASFEITDIPLIEYIASKGKPVIISIGIATPSEIDDAVNACRRMGNNSIALLKCTSSYPAPVEEANLLTIPDIAKKYNVIPGLSDHTLGGTVSVAAVALGARIIEKHFIIDRKIGGPDASFSMEPVEFKQMVDEIRIVEKALGKITYELTEDSIKSRTGARSLFIAEDIKKGELLTPANVRSVRPSYGLAPKYLPQVLGKKASIDLKKGTPLSWNFIDPQI